MRNLLSVSDDISAKPSRSLLKKMAETQAT